jgi:hypothetical protein
MSYSLFSSYPLLSSNYKFSKEIENDYNQKKAKITASNTEVSGISKQLLDEVEKWEKMVLIEKNGEIYTYFRRNKNGYVVEMYARYIKKFKKAIPE